MRGKRDIDRQCRDPDRRTYAMYDLGLHCLLISGSTLFALNTGYFINHTINKISQIPLLLEMDWSKQLRWKSPFGINGLRGKMHFVDFPSSFYRAD